jgi:phosphoesterase RecJ-like protein
MSHPADQISRIFRRENTFLILTHYRPDGDAVGSQLALAILLQDLGKTVTLWNDDPVPIKFQFLPRAHLIRRPPAKPQDFDVVVSIDVSNWQRVGRAAERIRNRKHFINIDHHVSNDRFATLNWIEPHAPASGQLAYELIRRGRFKLTKEIATCLFAAISTDTGSFSYANTTADSLRVAADLVDTGLNVGELSRHIYESYPYARLHLLQLVLADLKIADRKRVAYYWVTNEMFEESKATREDTEGLIDYARSINGVIVAVLFEELPEAGKVRISLRSKHPRVDANAIAQHFGGGGHKEAAGARLTGRPGQVEKQVLAAIHKTLVSAGLK